MRERSLDEFESIFEQASIPVLDIQEVALCRISAILTGDALDESVLAVAGYLKTRFGGEVEVHWPAVVDASQINEAARTHDFGCATDPFGSTAELLGQVGVNQSRLVLLPAFGPLVDVDTMVQGTTPPILLVGDAIGDPSDVFRRILHSLTGNFQQTQNFAYSFTLAEDSGELLLLHAIDETEVQDVRDALQVAPDIAAKTRDALLKNLARHGERYLKAVVAASRELPFEVGYRLAVGKVVPTVQEELARGRYGLLVVGSHFKGGSHVTADDYQLMHQVRSIPVLAL